jgi:murein endopeptidase
VIPRRRRRWLVQSGIASGLLVLATWTGALRSAPAVPAGQASTTPAEPLIGPPEAPELSSDAAESSEVSEAAPATAETAAASPASSTTTVATATAAAAAPPAPPAPPLWSERYFPFLEDESEQGSISVGDTSYGFLVGARHITEDAALGILPRQRERNLGYGSDQLIALLEDAARKVHARTRTRFWIGNIARRSGGDIAYSVSHNSGRDADIALALTDVKGVPVDPPDLLPLDSAGVSREKDHRYRFDTARTWEIVKALLESDQAQIEFLFLARSLTEKLLRHAREKKEPLELIERAALLLHQPAGAPHDDHLHIRVYCSERDVEGGCLDNGPLRPGVRLHIEARARRIERSVAALSHENAEQRARGVERLVVLQARDHKDAVLAKLDDPEGRVRAAAAAAVGQWGGGEDAVRIAKKLENEADPIARAALIAALADLGGPSAGSFFAAALARAGTLPWGRVAEAASQPAAPVPFLLMAEALSPLALFAPQLGLIDNADEAAFAMKLYVIDAAGFCDRPEPVEPLFPLLADTDPSVRAHAALSLSRLLNRPVDAHFQDPAAPLDVLMKATAELTQQAFPLRRSDRSPWMVEGFSRAGFKVPKIAAEHAWEILRSFRAGEPYSYNAGRALTRIALGTAAAEGDAAITRPQRPPVFEETLAECRYWLKWIDSRRSRLSLPKAPDNVVSACR